MFVVVTPDGARRWVRSSWQPVACVLNTDADAPPVDRYLQEELRERLHQGPARFPLTMAIGEDSDDFNDPSRPWPPNRVRVMMGILTLDAVPEDQVSNCERLSLSPLRLVPGIGPSDDPVLRVCQEATKSRSSAGGSCMPIFKNYH
jgi:catalase